MGSMLLLPRAVSCLDQTCAVSHFVPKNKAYAVSCGLLLGSVFMLSGDGQHMTEA
jgi:hypothetical protein